MDTSYAQAVLILEEAVDRAVNEAINHDGLTHQEVAAELRRIAQGWEDAA